MSTEVKSNFTLAGFHAWLMEKPDTVINHKSITTCAVGQYVIKNEDPAYKNLSPFNRAVKAAYKLPEALAHTLLDCKLAVSNFPTHLALAKHLEENYL